MFDCKLTVDLHFSSEPDYDSRAHFEPSGKIAVNLNRNIFGKTTKACSTTEPAGSVCDVPFHCGVEIPSLHMSVVVIEVRKLRGFDVSIFILLKSAPVR